MGIRPAHDDLQNIMEMPEVDGIERGSERARRAGADLACRGLDSASPSIDSSQRCAAM